MIQINNISTPQDEFWAGEFGDSYVSRNVSQDLLASNIHFFAEALSGVKSKIQTVLEIGANVGMNIRALQSLIPDCDFTGVEPNKKAIGLLQDTGCRVIEGFAQNVKIEAKFDLVLSKGVLIHINPINLEKTYNKLFSWSKKYILLAEYYNPTPMTVEYRGYSEKLFKRDFAGEMIDKFPSLEIVNYGFSYHRANFPQDDITWFLLEKRNL